MLTESIQFRKYKKNSHGTNEIMHNLRSGFIAFVLFFSLKIYFYQQKF